MYTLAHESTPPTRLKSSTIEHTSFIAAFNNIAPSASLATTAERPFIFESLFTCFGIRAPEKMNLQPQTDNQAYRKAWPGLALEWSYLVHVQVWHRNMIVKFGLWIRDSNNNQRQQRLFFSVRTLGREGEVELTYCTVKGLSP